MGDPAAPHVLVVEDEAKIATVLLEYLAGNGFRATHLDQGDQVLDWVAANSPDLLLLDLMLPGMSGLDICSELRKVSTIPIIMITARVDEIDRLRGLELGADDYITKPFSPREVIARVRVIFRRIEMMTGKSTATAGYRGLSIDVGRHQVSLEGSALDLTPVEFRLLALLAESPGRVYSRDQLMTAIYPDGRVVSDRTVDSHIKNLRKKLRPGFGEEEVVHSIYGVGYKFE